VTRREPLHHPRLYRALLRAGAAAIGRPDLPFHDLRHTYASLMAPTTKMEKLSRYMGDGTIAIIMDLYPHLYLDHDADEAAALDALYTATRPTTRVVGLDG